MAELLQQLAESLNISTHYSYFAGGKNVMCCASDELLTYLIEDMGYAAKNKQDIEKSLERIAKRRWQQALEAVYVNQLDNMLFDVVLRKDEAEDIEVFIANEGQHQITYYQAD